MFCELSATLCKGFHLTRDFELSAVVFVMPCWLSGLNLSAMESSKLSDCAEARCCLYIHYTQYGVLCITVPLKNYFAETSKITKSKLVVCKGSNLTFLACMKKKEQKILRIPAFLRT